MRSELHRFLRGFRYAASGVKAAFRAERNLRFHLCAAVYVLLFSRFYAFSRVEYALLFVCIGGVMSLELANSAVERAVDRPDAAHWAAAGLAKDMAAGSVLVFSLAAAAVGLALFWQPAVLAGIPAKLAANPLALVLLAVSLPCAVCFVLQPKKKG